MSPIATCFIERIRLHRVSPTLAFAEVRLPGVNLHGRQDSGGRIWAAYALQPGTREAVLAEIERLWDVAEAHG